jgi:hypothetical protein
MVRTGASWDTLKNYLESSIPASVRVQAGTSSHTNTSGSNAVKPRQMDGWKRLTDRIMEDRKHKEEEDKRLAEERRAAEHDRLAKLLAEQERMRSEAADRDRMRQLEQV